MSYGIPQDQIELLESKLETITFSSIVDRLDAALGKAWSYQFEGPDVIDVPTRVPKFPKAKNPKAFKTVDVPYYKCSCTIILHVVDGIPMVREYTLQIPVDEGAFEVARDLAFIYTAHHGWGVGKRSTELFPKLGEEVTVELGESATVIDTSLKVLANLKAKLGFKRNAELDPLVQEWSNGEMSSHYSINKTNILKFNEFLQSKVDDAGKLNQPQ